MVEWPEKNIALYYATDNQFTPNSLFEWGSITKTFTALAVLHLLEQKNLTLYEPVVKYLKSFNFNKVTIEHLLAHTSGLPQGIPPYFDDDYTTKELLAHTKEIPLLSVPGEKYNYSNLGYIYLRLLIEQISGQPYVRYLNTIGLSPCFSEQKDKLLIGHTLSANKSNVQALETSKKAHSQTIEWASGLYGSITMLFAVAKLS